MSGWADPESDPLGDLREHMRLAGTPRQYDLEELKWHAEIALLAELDREKDA